MTFNPMIMANVGHAAAPMMMARMGQSNPLSAPMQQQPTQQNTLAPGMNPYRQAISNIESGSREGNYGVIGPPTKNGGRAYGRYQVMDFNIPSWTREVLGREYTPQEFLADPAAQDAVFDAKFGSYIQRYGSPQDAASVWFSGRPLSGNTSSDGYINVPEYVRRFNAGLGNV